MREESRSRVQIAMSKSALAPVLEQQATMLEAIHRLTRSIEQIPDRIVEGEETRARRLHEVISPLAKATGEGAQLLATTYSSLMSRQEAEAQALREEMAQLREEIESLRETSAPSILSTEMERLRRLMVALPDAIARHLVDRVPAPPPTRQSLGTPASNVPVPPNAESEKLLQITLQVFQESLGNNPKSMDVVQRVLAEARKRAGLPSPPPLR
jgi:hypothetical protein